MSKPKIIKISLGLLMLNFAALFTGCSEVVMEENDKWAKQRYVKVRKVSAEVGDATLAKNLIKDDEKKQTGATGAALRWADKYAEAAKELVSANRRIRAQEVENQKSKTKIAQLSQELKKTQRELQDANEVLMDLKSDLKKWRTDVLGFREEQNKSLKAIIISQKKILELLGAEVPVDTGKSSVATKNK